MSNRRKRTYTIYRFYLNGKREVIRKGVSLQFARDWCSRDDTRKEGKWFDGFIQE